MGSPNPAHCHLCGGTANIEDDYQFRHYATDDILNGPYSDFRGPTVHPGDTERHIKLCEECEHVVKTYRTEVYNPAIHAVVNPRKAEAFIRDLEASRPKHSVDWGHDQLFKWYVEDELVKLLKDRRSLSLPRPDSSESSFLAGAEQALLERQGPVDLDDEVPKYEVEGFQGEEQRKSGLKERLRRWIKKFGWTWTSRKRTPPQ